jgi:DNA-binding NarL/FixJ family response regulator
MAKIRKTIKVGIADDHKIFRRGVISSLRQNSSLFDFVFECDNGEELLEQVELYQPDVILMDIKMPKMDGIEATRIISRKYPEIKIIALTMIEDERYVMYMLDNGASGYLLKNTDPEEIKTAILSVLRDKYYLNSDLKKIVINRKNGLDTGVRPIPSKEHKVTEKEREILEAICLEYSAKEIGEKLGMSNRTVESIKKRLQDRFGVRNVAGLVYYAVKNYIV